MKRTSTPEEEAYRLAELCIFRWYTLCAEEYDQLSSDGLNSLHEAIEDVLLEEGAARGR